MSLLNKLTSLFGSGRPPADISPLNILVIGLAKSGTSILMYRISKGIANAQEYFEPRAEAGQADIAFHQEVCRRPGHAVVKIVYHPNQPEQLQQIIPLYDKVVWIIRDPRDQMISEFFYVWFREHAPAQELFLQALARTRQKESDPATVPFYQLAGLVFPPRRQERIYNKVLRVLESLRPHLFVLHYEDLMGSQLEALHRYLGFSINTRAQVSIHYRRVARSRKADNWRRWFTPEDVAVYQPILHSYLDALGYDPNDWALTPVSALPAREGSEYMIRLYGG